MAAALEAAKQKRAAHGYDPKAELEDSRARSRASAKLKFGRALGKLKTFKVEHHGHKHSAHQHQQKITSTRKNRSRPKFHGPVPYYES